MSENIFAHGAKAGAGDAGSSRASGRGRPRDAARRENAARRANRPRAERILDSFIDTVRRRR